MLSNYVESHHQIFSATRKLSHTKSPLCCRKHWTNDDDADIYMLITYIFLTHNSELYL